MCKRLANNTIVINRYKNPHEHNHPVPVGSEDGGDFIPGQQVFTDGTTVCQFTLSNFTSETTVSNFPPLSLSGTYHPLFAVGPLNASGKLFIKILEEMWKELSLKKRMNSSEIKIVSFMF